MNVLIVSHHAPPHIGGLENLVDLEARALIEAGHQVTWVTSDLGGRGHEPASDERLRVVRVRAWHVIERRFNLAYPLFSPRLLSVLWRELAHADALHAHGLIFTSTITAMLLARLRRRPRLLTDHGTLVLRYPSRWASLGLAAVIQTFGRLNCRLADRLIAYNGRVQQLLERLSGRSGQCLFLPNPLDRRRFFPPTQAQRAAARAGLGWSHDRPKVLFVGRLVADKGIDALLAADEPRFDLVFCGPGEPAVLHRLARRGAEHLPPRPQDELIEVYHAADALALPSWNEGFPVVIQEALACGLSVVTTDDPGYAPYHGTPDLYFSDRRPDALRQTILRALEHGSPPTAAISPPVEAAAPDMDQWLARLFSGIAGFTGPPPVDARVGGVAH